MVLARSANPKAILYDPAIRAAGGNGGDAGRPDELLLVYRMLIHALGNSAYVGELPVWPGVRTFLFNRGGSGTLIMWNESAAAPEVPLDLPLGATPRLTDLLGNQDSVSLNPASGLSHLVVTRSPLVLDQIDPRALQLKTSFAFSVATLPAGVGSIRAEVMLTNPYAEGITGTLRIGPPKGWSTDPSTLSVALAPGVTLRRAITIRYPFTENAGPKEVRARLSLDRSPSVAAQELELVYPVSITSDQVQLAGFSQMLDNGDIVIQQMITNISNAPLNAQAYALLPNYPRQQHYVLALPPGQTAIKRFTFPASTFVQSGTSSISPGVIAAALAHQTATLGLRQNDGTTLLTKTIPLE